MPVMKIATVVGARPNFIKLAPLSAELERRGHEEIVVHTGQHYDYEMSRIFFQELEIPEPNFNLGVGSGTHAQQTGEVLLRIEEVLLSTSPDMVVVFGDVNSTLGAALAACKIDIPVAHVEAGARSFDRTMPEEINRVLVDHISSILFPATRTAFNNLLKEGISEDWIHLPGDIMLDTFLQNRSKIDASQIVDRLSLLEQGYVLVTIHRAENTDKPERLTSILETLTKIDRRKVICLHPRTRKTMKDHGLSPMLDDPSFTVTKPLGYVDFLKLVTSADAVITDSGGVQKEAYLAKRTCLTLRSTTEWPETVDSGWNELVDADPERILEAYNERKEGRSTEQVFGDGRASTKMVDALEGFLFD
jgi:UDP-N-acetylglucosamine 2-epimerase